MADIYKNVLFVKPDPEPWARDVFVPQLFFTAPRECHTLARQQLAAGDVDGAIKTLEKGAEVFSYNSPFYRRIAAVRQAFGKSDPAITALISHEPRSDDVAANVTQPPGQRAATTWPVLASPRDQISSGNVTPLIVPKRFPASYIKEAERLSKEEANDSEDIRQQKIRAAISVLAAGHALYPADLSIVRPLASLYVGLKEIPKALEVLKSAQGRVFSPLITRDMAQIYFDRAELFHKYPSEITAQLFGCALLLVNYGSKRQNITDDNYADDQAIRVFVLRLITETGNLPFPSGSIAALAINERKKFTLLHSSAAQAAYIFGHHAEALALLDRSEGVMTQGHTLDLPSSEKAGRLLLLAEVHFALNLKYKEEYKNDAANEHLLAASRAFRKLEGFGACRPTDTERMDALSQRIEPPPAPATLPNEGASAEPEIPTSNIINLMGRNWSPENYMNRATRFFNAGQPTAATEILNLANAEFPYDAPVALLLVAIYAHRDHFRRAQEILLKCQNDEIIPAVSNALAQLHLVHADACTTPRAVTREYAACANTLIAHHIHKPSASPHEADPAWATAQRIANDLIAKTQRLPLPPRHGRSRRERAARLNAADLLYKVAEVAQRYDRPEAALQLLKRSERVALPNAKAMITWAETHYELSRHLNDRRDQPGAIQHFREARRACALAKDFGMSGERVEERVSLLKVALDHQSKFFPALRTAPR